MGFVSFIKNAGKKLGQGITKAGKFVGERIAPVVHSIASTVEKYAPYVAGAAGALGIPELAAGAATVGRFANKVADFSKGVPRPPPPSQPSGGGGPPRPAIMGR